MATTKAKKTSGSRNRKDYGTIFLVIAIVLVLTLTVYVTADGLLHRTNLLTDKSFINSMASVLNKYPAGITQKDLDEIKIIVFEANPYSDGYSLALGRDDALGLIKKNEADAEARRNDPDYSAENGEEFDFDAPSVEDLLVSALSEDNIKDFSSLSLFKNLEYLVVNGPDPGYSPDSLKELRDLSFLESLTSLTNLRLSNIGASDFSPVAKLTPLKSLTIMYCLIGDPSVFESLNSLESLNLTVTPGVSDISFVSSLGNIRDLYMRGNGIEDISPLKDLTNIRDLYLDSNQISDVSALSGLTSLNNLNLSDNGITDIEPLSGLTALKELYLSGNDIDDASPIFNLSSLTDLRIGANNLTGIDGIENCAALETFYADENNIIDISPLASLKNLSMLSLNDNNILGVGPLAGLENLAVVYLDANFIEDFSVLDSLEESGVYISGRDAQKFDFGNPDDFDDSGDISDISNGEDGGE
ncbi:MAG: leucine-rich repeat domain-containing protein [Oscillospiraceae bacterium]|nr:leucine-rich repeat domain-containing protein [Oscillospiraceae bacterium]